MNREILFKAKRKDNGEWVEGYYVYEHNKKTHCILQNELSTCLNAGSKPDFRDYILEPYEVNHDTLCQYTGLTDKNGNKIWENDIVDAFEESANRVLRNIVVFRDGCFMVCRERNLSVFFDNYNPSDFEVKGNIFDNSDLLEIK